MDDAPKKPARKAPKKITASYLHNAGLAYLQRFPSSTGNFRAVLMRKVDKSCRHHTEQDRDACAALVEDTLTKFQDMGLLNDEAYLRGMVTSYRRRGLSATAIKAKLAAKRLPADAVTEAIARHRDDGGPDDLAAAVLHARKKKIGPFQPATREENRDKAMAAMARAGFSYDIAGKVLSMEADEADALIRATT